MIRHTSPDRTGPHGQGGGDPWVAFGYLVAGIGFYGAVGWALGRWLSIDYLTPLGIVFGAALALYLVFHRYAGPPPSNDIATNRTSSSETTDEAGPAGETDR
jgi:ATP synthase protein I